MMEKRDWLVQQLEAWPKRVDPELTTNIEFLMKSAAERIRKAENTRPLTGGVTPEMVEAGSKAFLDFSDGKIIGSAVIEAIYLAMSNVSRGVK
jgi:hypothetical protein